MKRSKFLLLLTLLALAALYVALDLNRFFSLDYLQRSQQSFERLYAEQPLQVIGLYFVIYVAVTALSFPGAVMLTLAGGALFGLGWGTLIISFASSMGATLAFLTARFVLRDSIEARFGPRLAEFNRGLENEGAFYLFTLRLVPLMPFFVINLLMGLTQMKVKTYYWVSQLGMLAGTLVYVNAGTQLAQLTSLQGILSPALLGSFVLLGVFPLAARQVTAALKQRQVLAPWQHLKPKTFDRNLIVIGGGAGGLVSAYIAAAVRAKVTLVEAHKLGGDCLHYGCVPSKALIKSARVAHQITHASRYGLSDSTPAFSFKAVMQRVFDVIAAIEPHDSVARYTALGVDVVQGYARIVNPWTVEITLNGDGTQPEGERQKLRLTTRAIVIAAGAQPVVPPLPGLDAVGYLTSDTLWHAFAQLDAVPKRLLVLGGGPMGCELAQSFQRLGAQVTQVEGFSRLLRREDADVSELVQASLERDGVRVLTGHQALRCEPLPQQPPSPQPSPKGRGSQTNTPESSLPPGGLLQPAGPLPSGGLLQPAGPLPSGGLLQPAGPLPFGGLLQPGGLLPLPLGEGWGEGCSRQPFGPGVLIAKSLKPDQNNGLHQEVRIEFDALLCAVGREARLTGYGLEDLGIPTQRTIDTNAHLQTLYPTIFAAGDVAGPYQLTHVAAHQAWYATVNALFGDLKKFKADYSAMPSTTFTDPEVARVGLNEQEAQAQNIAVEVTQFSLDDLDRALADSEAQGFVKVLTVPGKDTLLGVTIVGPQAGELLAEYVLAMKHGLGLNKILGTVHSYPTLAEANKYAAGQWKRAHAPQKLLEWAQKYHAWRRGLK